MILDAPIGTINYFLAKNIILHTTIHYVESKFIVHSPEKFANALLA